MATPDKSKIFSRIKALLAKTVERGCTEAEAMEAAEKAGKLIAEYQIDMTEAELVGEGFTHAVWAWKNKKTFFIKNFTALGVAFYTDTKVWNETRADKKKNQIFYGLKSDADFALWLSDSLADYVIRAADAWLKKECREGRVTYNVNKAWDDFALGAAGRISQRLMEAKQAPVVKSATGTGLAVIDKKSLVEKAFAELEMGAIKKARGGARKINWQRYSDGVKAGDGASFSRPIAGGKSSHLMIGRD